MLSRRPTFTAEELGARADALALQVGTKATASALLLACVVVILVGAQSLLGTMQGMDRDIKEMNAQLAVANGGVTALNKTMDSLAPTARSLDAIVGTVKTTGVEVKKSAGSIDTLSTSTDALSTRLEAIGNDTKGLSTSLESTASGTGALGSTIGDLSTQVGPLVTMKRELLGNTRHMRDGLDGMNASLAYVVRILNYMTAPPTKQPMSVRIDLPPLKPDVPGVAINSRPVPVFDWMQWPIYQGP
ncbi:MAG: hypothetical protein JWM25_1637 [Thermoleophilia bacterium]|nr:hypothetical protein [Thermoleophilia bacterium]